MPSPSNVLKLLWTTFGIVLVFAVFSSVQSVGSPEAEKSDRLDRILLDRHAFGSDQMPPVAFFHDLHTQRIQEKQCRTCHVPSEGEFVFEILTDQNPASTREVFHELCLGCHEQTEKSGKTSGPLTGECRKCHRAGPEPPDVDKTLPFGRLLHARHKEIDKGLFAEAEQNSSCGACHHQYDEETDTLFYHKGREVSCRYCHNSENADRASGMRTIAHNTCVSCHQKTREQDSGQAAAPIECQGCHGGTWSASKDNTQDLPRLYRNQPDSVLLSSWLGAADSLMQEREARQVPPIQPVVFQHKMHEESAENCRSCHHEAMQPCRDCHPSGLALQEASVSLDQAMHDPDSELSCIGCHNTMKRSEDCAGCHDQMPRRPFPKSRCTVCHSVEAGDLEARRGREDPKGVFNSTIQDEQIAEGIDCDALPHHVVLDTLDGPYEPVHLPHKKIVVSLQKQLAASHLATSFHGGIQALCQGCHHTNFDRKHIQACGSCHRAEPGLEDDRPDLKSAYHGQCITCHQKMNLQGLSARECSQCHRTKNTKGLSKAVSEEP